MSSIAASNDAFKCASASAAVLPARASNASLPLLLLLLLALRNAAPVCGGGSADRLQAFSY
jgi:hypothetical protein